MVEIAFALPNACGLSRIYFRDSLFDWSGFPLNLFQQLLPALPCFVVRLFICRIRVRSFARAHESMSRSFVSDRLVSLAGLLHHFAGFWNRRIDPRIVAAVKAVDRALNASQILLRFRGWPIKRKRTLDLLIVGRKAERLATTPAKSSHDHLA